MRLVSTTLPLRRANAMPLVFPGAVAWKKRPSTQVNTEQAHHCEGIGHIEARTHLKNIRLVSETPIRVALVGVAAANL